MNEAQSNLLAGRNGKILGVILKSYLFFAAIVFSGTAVAKLLSDFSDTELKSYDPFLRFLTAGQSIVLMVLLEIGVVVYVLFNFFRHPVFALRFCRWAVCSAGCFRCFCDDSFSFCGAFMGIWTKSAALIKASEAL